MKILLQQEKTPRQSFSRGPRLEKAGCLFTFLSPSLLESTVWSFLIATGRLSPQVLWEILSEA